MRRVLAIIIAALKTSCSGKSRGVSVVSLETPFWLNSYGSDSYASALALALTDMATKSKKNTTVTARLSESWATH